MNTQLPRSDQDLLSRFLDNDLSSEERVAFERRLAAEPGLRTAFDELLQLRAVLARKPTVGPDPYFWTRLSARLQARRAEEQNLLPFPRRYVPGVMIGTAIVVLGIGFWIAQYRIPLVRFWERQSSSVREAYHQTLAQSSMTPFFANLDPDRTLQFALYGSLPLDEEKGTTLRVDEQSADGYRIEVKKEVPRHTRKVTMEDFVAEVRPTGGQRTTIDSVLMIAREQLQAAVLVGNNDVVAINADLNGLNKAMVSGLASCLEPEQRVRLNRLMEERESPYVMMNRTERARPAEEVLATLRHPQSRREFVVLTPETLMLSRLDVDMRGLRESIVRNGLRGAEVAARHARVLERLVGQWDDAVPPVIAPEATSRLSIRARPNRFTIRVQADTVPDGVVYRVSVAPRVPTVVEDDDAGFLPDAPTSQRAGARPRVVVVPAPGSRERPDSVERKPRRPFPLEVHE